jgi:hypothetical protein
MQHAAMMRMHAYGHHTPVRGDYFFSPLSRAIITRVANPRPSNPETKYFIRILFLP